MMVRALTKTELLCPRGPCFIWKEKFRFYRSISKTSLQFGLDNFKDDLKSIDFLL